MIDLNSNLDYPQYCAQIDEIGQQIMTAWQHLTANNDSRLETLQKVGLLFVTQAESYKNLHTSHKKAAEVLEKQGELFNRLYQEVETISCELESLHQNIEMQKLQISDLESAYFDAWEACEEALTKNYISRGFTATKIEQRLTTLGSVFEATAQDVDPSLNETLINSCFSPDRFPISSSLVATEEDESFQRCTLLEPYEIDQNFNIEDLSDVTLASLKGRRITWMGLQGETTFSQSPPSPWVDAYLRGQAQLDEMQRSFEEKKALRLQKDFDLRSAQERLETLQQEIDSYPQQAMQYREQLTSTAQELIPLIDNVATASLN